MARPWMPTAMRSAFIIENMALRPWCGSPMSQPVAPSRFITQVGQPWMPILCSTAPQEMPLRSPSVPSAFTSTFGTRNRLMPLEPFGASGSRASTK